MAPYGGQPGYGPQGGYGQPGYGPQGGYGQPGQTPPGSAATVDVGAAFSWSWTKLWQNGTTLVGGSALFAVAVTVVYGLFYGIYYILMLLTASSSSPDGASAGVLLVGLVGYVLMWAVIAFMYYIYLAGLIRSTLAISAGEKPALGSMFSLKDSGRILGTALLTSLIIGVGMLLLYLPGIVAAFFLMFSVKFAVDKQLGPIDAMKASFNLVKANVGSVILVWLVAGVASSVGTLACGVGVLVTVPLALLLQTYAYRRLTNAYIAP